MTSYSLRMELAFYDFHLASRRRFWVARLIGLRVRGQRAAATILHGGGYPKPVMEENNGKRSFKAMHNLSDEQAAIIQNGANIASRGDI